MADDVGAFVTDHAKMATFLIYMQIAIMGATDYAWFDPVRRGPLKTALLRALSLKIEGGKTDLLYMKLRDAFPVVDDKKAWDRLELTAIELRKQQRSTLTALQTALAVTNITAAQTLVSSARTPVKSIYVQWCQSQQEQLTTRVVLTKRIDARPDCTAVQALILVAIDAQALTGLARGQRDVCGLNIDLYGNDLGAACLLLSEEGILSASDKLDVCNIFANDPNNLGTSLTLSSEKRVATRKALSSFDSDVESLVKQFLESEILKAENVENGTVVPVSATELQKRAPAAAAIESFFTRAIAFPELLFGFEFTSTHIDELTVPKVISISSLIRELLDVIAPAFTKRPLIEDLVECLAVDLCSKLLGDGSMDGTLREHVRRILGLDKDEEGDDEDMGEGGGGGAVGAVGAGTAPPQAVKKIVLRSAHFRIAGAFIHALRKAAQRWLISDDVGILLPVFPNPQAKVAAAAAAVTAAADDDDDDSDEEIIVIESDEDEGYWDGAFVAGEKDEDDEVEEGIIEDEGEEDGSDSGDDD